VKIDTLLAPYFYQYKRLSLPGIGLFTLDDKAVLPDENSKVKMSIEGITFSPKTGQQLDDSLVQYIKDHTGKMKPLAEADLHSFIATAFQYLNIGKPYYFEGIGTLQKNKDNGYSFTAGTVIQRTEELPHKHIETKRKSAGSTNEDAVGGSSFNTGKLITGLLVLITLALIGWGGYYLYNKNTAEPEKPTPAETKPLAAPDTTAVAIDSAGKKPDSLGGGVKTDSAMAKPVEKTEAPVAATGTGYKFIFETTAKKTRAVKRYEQLKGSVVLKEYNNKVAVETRDSLTFKIYTIVPCTPADTTRIKDLLNAWYYGTKEMKVKIQQ